VATERILSKKAFVVKKGSMSSGEGGVGEVSGKLVFLRARGEGRRSALGRGNGSSWSREYSEAV
jgi:hypothetical protein